MNRPDGQTLIWRKTAARRFRYKETGGPYPYATNDRTIYG